MQSWEGSRGELRGLGIRVAWETSDKCLTEVRLTSRRPLQFLQVCLWHVWFPGRPLEGMLGGE